MMRRCARPDCFVHDGESCALGERDFQKCGHWSTSSTNVEVDPQASPRLPADAARVPWSGSALGLSDLGLLAPRARTILVGVLGAHDAGKTTLLTGSYLSVLRGETIAGTSFAGSRTLGAWESLAAWVRFDDAARKPSFPPHTPRGTSRVPGLLHLTLRGPREDIREVFFTDAPGEWFTRWSIHEEAPEADGARWIARHADAFLVLADCARLSGEKRGQARADIREMLSRLGNHVGRRPVVLVWAKADHDPSEGIQKAIRAALRTHIPLPDEVRMTVKEPATFKAALEKAVLAAWEPPLARALTEPVVQHDPFGAFRGTHAHA